jgi:hypothetical protein
MPGVLTFLGLEHAKEMVAKYSAPPVLAAVILTTLLPNVLVLKTIDSWILGRFQRWGRIPRGVRDLADDLQLDSLTISDDDLTKLKAWILSNKYAPDELADYLGKEAIDTSRGCLTRLIKLYSEMEKLNHPGDYAHAIERRQNKWQTIEADFRIFLAQSQAFFVLFERLAHLHGLAGDSALKQAEGHYEKICSNMGRNLIEFLAQLLLEVEGSQQCVTCRVRKIGFASDVVGCPPILIGPFVFTGFVVIIAILATTVAFVNVPPHPLPIPVIAVIIGTTQTIGILAAILPKLRFAWFRTRDDNLPFIAWLASAAIAGVCAFVVDRCAYSIIDHSLWGGLDFARFPLRPGAPMAAALALSISILCDVNFPLGSGWLRRISEGMMCGAVLAGAIFLCIHLLDLPSATQGQAPAWFPFVFSFVLGFVWGFIGPHIYRQVAGLEPNAGAPPLVERRAT